MIKLIIWAELIGWVENVVTMLILLAKAMFRECRSGEEEETESLRGRGQILSSSSRWPTFLVLGHACVPIRNRPVLHTACRLASSRA